MLNAKETTLAAQKQQAIREAFRDWIWRDSERRQTLVSQYNEEMNSIRPREYDGSHITFGGMNPAITLREHQKSAIAHVLYGGNTLLAHEVGLLEPGLPAAREYLGDRATCDEDVLSYIAFPTQAEAFFDKRDEIGRAHV